VQYCFRVDADIHRERFFILWRKSAQLYIHDLPAFGGLPRKRLPPATKSKRAQLFIKFNEQLFYRAIRAFSSLHRGPAQAVVKNGTAIISDWVASHEGDWPTAYRRRSPEKRAKPDKSKWAQNHFSGKRCGLNWSAQHLREVYSLESRSPKSFADVDLDAARSCPVGIACSRKDRFSSAGIDAAGGWCFRLFLAARGCADHRNKLSHLWPR